MTWQALRGQSVVAPDALTLTAAIGLLLAVQSAVLIGIGRARSRARRSAVAAA